MMLTKDVVAIDDEWLQRKDLNLEFYKPDSVSRHHVENFIHQVFARAYQADLKHFLPNLMALRGNEGRIVSALGMRHAITGPLFLESYFETPVETVISQLHGTKVSREKIMEVGNLASIHRGGLRKLIVALTSYLSGAGIEWVLFTAVPAVRKAFAGLDLHLHPIAEADKSRLHASEQACWGRYYDTSPVVVAGKVEDGYLRLRELIELEKTVNLGCLYLWQYAFVMGSRQRSLAADSVLQARENAS